MSSDYGRHVSELRRRARRPEPKDRSGRDNELRAAIEADLEEEEPVSGDWDSPGTSPEDDDDR